MGIRTDLALEAAENLENIDGIKCNTKNINDMKITQILITSDAAEKKLGKLKGKYITIEIPSFTRDFRDIDDKSKIISDQIKSLLPDKGLIFVVGLGNRDITPDALGPETIGSILATRHISGKIAQSIGLDNLRSVATLAPGVLGQTGMEVVEIIKSIIKEINPAAIIVIDALASREISRLGCTIQISDTGISPGSGVGNARPGINEKTLNVPVISIGIPTVVDALTLITDLLKSNNYNFSPDMQKKITINNKSMIVTPKEIDLLIQRAAKLLSLSINSALQPNFSIKEIMSLIE